MTDLAVYRFRGRDGVELAWREVGERNKCRVQVFREETGAAGLSGRGMPTDQTLAAHASVCARAQEYKESGPHLYTGTQALPDMIGAVL